MNITSRPKIVLLGMMGKMRVAGAVWQTLHYLIGLERLGYDVFYVEAHKSKSWAFRDEHALAGFLDHTLRQFDFGDKWALHAVSGSGAYHGMSEGRVHDLYNEAAAILNLHGGTVPTPEMSAAGRLVYIDTDPVKVQVEIEDGVPFTLDFLSQHSAFFTFAENYGKPDCRLPVSNRFGFKPTRQPVVLDFWNVHREPGDRFTTVGNWEQIRRVVVYQGEEYLWSKHFEFQKFLDLPRRTSQEFELALGSCDEQSRTILRENGWYLHDAMVISHESDRYRSYIAQSKAEFTVAKDQNVRMRTGWFSDRSATYLAAGRPVVTQATGFENLLPHGEGLFGFVGMDDILAAVEGVNQDYRRHCSAAAAIARECFSYEVVLPALLSEIGLRRRVSRPDNRQVSVVGHFLTAGGMATAARRFARAVESAGWDAKQIDLSQPPGADGLGGINLMCCHIASYFTARAGLGEDFFSNRYNIGVWLWELPDFPEAWYDRFVYHDEIWAPSSFIASALSPVAPIPVVRIPLVLETDISGSRERGRRRLGVDADFVFAFVFDGHSGFARKNPAAVIDAFNAAFQPTDPARLVIKCVHGDFERAQFLDLVHRAEGRRVSIYDEEWSAGEIADLTAACDCYVSLHRAEGVAQTIGDAMAARKPVIATGWSGNMDFMNLMNSYPVKYQLTRLHRRVAHYPANGLWAEPSCEDAAQLMRHVFHHREEAAARGETGWREIHANYSTDAVARIIARRLELIAKRGKLRELRLSLAEGSSVPAGSSCLGSYGPTAHLDYLTLKEQLRDTVRACVPSQETLVVVSKGDEDLLRLHKGPSLHFPQGDGGKYAGYYPADSADAIRHLDSLHAQGGRFLLFPRTAFWWLEHYTGFADHLEREHRLVHRDVACRIFQLVGTPAATAEGL